MRLIDADALMDDIKRDSKKAIDEGDKVGSFWLGYAAGLVIKLPTIQPEKAQLSQQGTTSDLISRTETVERLRGVIDVTVPITDYDGGYVDGVEVGVSTVSTMPPIQPVATDTNVGDTISKFIDGLEEIFADLRERHVDDSVCGLCEYDGAYMGQSGDWCNECPGFDRDDCFKLSDETRKKWTDEIIKALPTVQPETLTDKEQRIFLAAMGREEKVCRQVDDECGDCRDSDSLVRTCHEITRKVKGTLWT